MDWPPRSPKHVAARARVRSAEACNHAVDALQHEQAKLERRLAEIKRQRERTTEEPEPPSTPTRQRIQVVRSPLGQSPKRQLLGIDKGLTGKDVSLARVPMAGAAPARELSRASQFVNRLASARSEHAEQAARKTRQQARAVASFDTSRDEKSEDGSVEGFMTTYGIHLAQQTLSNASLHTHLNGKRVVSLHEFLGALDAPDFAVPAEWEEEDYVVWAIMAAKSGVKDTKKGAKDHKNSSKYCVLTLTDLNLEVGMFLFGAAFDRYYKLQPGTVVAILNPSVAKPRGAAVAPTANATAASAVALKISDAYDVVLEIGRSRDMGFCSAMTRDSTQCTTWIDTRKTQVCEYHLDVGLDRVRSSRMNLQGTGMGGRPRHMKATHGGGGKRGRGGQKYFQGTLIHAGSNASWQNAQGLFDEPEQLTAEERKERQRRQAERADSERKILQGLNKQNARSTAAEYLGLGGEEELGNSAAGGRFRPFSAVHLRKIGFDPTARHPGQSRIDVPATAAQVEQLSARPANVRLSPVKKRHRRMPSDDSDDLEIV